MKLDTYLQKVELGEKRVAIDEREVARLYSRHQSSAAYILTREGAARYLELTASACCRPIMRFSPTIPAGWLAHLSALSRDRDPGPPSRARPGRSSLRNRDGCERRERTRRRSSTLEKLWRESVRLVGQVAGLMEWSYQKAFLRLKTTTVGVG